MFFLVDTYDRLNDWDNNQFHFEVDSSYQP